MKVHIFIATTQGPVAVQSVAEEDSDVQSVVCVDGGVEPLAISERYHDFVKRGTGLLQKDFGGPAYRLDIAERIDQGNSWQLPVYLAHHLQKLGVLGEGNPVDGDTVIWATGAIKANRSVHSVEEIPAKIAKSMDLFEQLLGLGVPTLLLVPETDTQTLDACSNDWREGYQQYDTCSLFPVSQLHEATNGVTRHIGGNNTEAALPIAISSQPSRSRWFVSAGLSAALVLGYVSYTQSEKGAVQVVNPVLTPPNAAPAHETGSINAVGRKPLDDFEDSAELDAKRRQWQQQQREDSVERTIIVVQLGEYPGDCQEEYIVERELRAHSGQFADVPINRLCGLAIEPVDKVNAIVAIALDNGAIIPVNNDSGVWQLKLPKHNKRTRDYALLALESAQAEDVSAALAIDIKQHVRSSKPISIGLLEKIMQRRHWRGEVYWQKLKMEG